MGSAPSNLAAYTKVRFRAMTRVINAVEANKIDCKDLCTIAKSIGIATRGISEDEVCLELRNKARNAARGLVQVAKHLGIKNDEDVIFNVLHKLGVTSTELANILHPQSVRVLP